MKNQSTYKQAIRFFGLLERESFLYSGPKETKTAFIRARSACLYIMKHEPREKEKYLKEEYERFFE
jgi:hypothetical protein